MNGGVADPKSSLQDLLSKVSRYEALLELTGVINTANDIESLGAELARRLKYIADIYAWRYICFEGDPENAEQRQPTTIVIDGHRGRADVRRTEPSALSEFETDLWQNRKANMLCGDAMRKALEHLPESFRKDDLEQISINTLVEDGKTQALYLFCKRRQPFTDLDIKCLTTVCSFFHRKIYMLWEQQQLRDLELAYLQQELMLRQSERLATLGRLSAGMAHELNNPAAAAKQGAVQLRNAIDRLERAQLALGEVGMSDDQREAIAALEREAAKLTATSSPLDPIARSDLEQEVEQWLDCNGVQDAWKHAPVFVEIGLETAELEELSTSFDPFVMPSVIDFISSRFEVVNLLEDVNRGAERISEIITALKGYSFMDQAPVQMVDVREGLDHTLVMLGSKLRDGIDVRLEYDDQLPRIQGHGSELNQVWTHLIDNAVSAMGEDGELELKAYRDDGWVVVEVADSGPGIPTDIQGKIFDPFFTTRSPGEGAGLGLSISHGIVVQKHRGQISVDSKPGATRFAVKLPISDESSSNVEKREKL